MSFGWSIGDIVAALKLLYQIGNALKESGGASSELQDTLSFLQTLSRTIQHLNTLQSTSLDPDLAENLQEQCDHIRVPLQAFLDDVKRRFEPGLGVNSRRHRILATSRKIQWALSTSKKVKKLQDRVAVPMAAVGVMLGQQIVQTTLRMPSDIQDRMSYAIDRAIDTKITPATTLVNDQIEALSAKHAASADLIAQKVQEIGRTTAEAIHSNATKDRDVTTRLENGLDLVLVSQMESAEALVDVHTKLEDLSVAHSASADVVVRSLRQTRQDTAKALRMQAFGDRAQSSSLHKKLDRVDTSIGAIRNLLLDLSSAQLDMGPQKSKSKVEAAIENILRSMWILLSSLQVLIRELVMLLAPYMIVFYKSSIQHLMHYGDHFLFQDVIGRLSRLSCVQFQHWNIFYDFLINSFRDAPGLSLVVRERFMVMNGYNNYPISRKAWRAVIQPRSKVTMAMILDGTAVKQGKCADLSCPGRVVFTAAKATRICLICGKHLSTFPANGLSLKPAPSVVNSAKDLEQEIYAKLSTVHDTFEMGPKRPMIDHGSQAASFLSERDVNAFKRVAYQEGGNPVLFLLPINGTFDRKTISVPYYPGSLRFARQTKKRKFPTYANGFFDTKVVSRKHAEIWADRNGKVWIHDLGSSNGTFVNGVRLSAENQISEARQLQTQDRLILGCNVVVEGILHHFVAARVAVFPGPGLGWASASAQPSPGKA